MDPFRQLKAGEVIPGIPREAWNAFLELLKAKGGGRGQAQPVGGPIEVLVKNATASPVGRFGVLQPTAPRSTYTSAGSGDFFDEDIVQGGAPAAGSPFVVMQEPVSPGGFAVGRLLGLTRCKVNMTSTSHRYADATTATTKLTSAASGPARILWTEDSFAGTGDKWAVVELLGTSTSAGASLVGTTSGTFSAASGATPTTQNLFTTVAAGFYHLVGTVEASTPLAPSSQCAVYTKADGTVTPTPNQWFTEILATAGSFTSNTMTVSAFYTFTGPSNTVTLIGNSAGTAIQTMGYAYKFALVKMA